MSAREITISKAVTIEPFFVPNYVYVVEYNEPNLKLRDISRDILTAMCDEWCAAVFAAAGCVDPAKENQS